MNDLQQAGHSIPEDREQKNNVMLMLFPAK